MATAVNNRPGTKAHARMVRMSASKARVVLNLIRGKQVNEALEILSFSERLAADVIAKCLTSAVANAEHNDDLDANELFVSACFADEGPTLKRFRPRARGRAGRIHKQTCHITIEVSRYTEDELDRLRVASELKNEGRQARSAGAGDGGDRARRVAKSRAADEVEETADEDAAAAEDVVEETTEAVEETTAAVEEATDEVAADSDSGEEAGEAAEDSSSEEAEAAAEEVTDEVATDEDAADDAGEKD